MPAVALVKNLLADVLPGFPAQDVVLSAGAMVFGLLGLLAAQLAGIFWVVRNGIRALGDQQRWLLSVLAAGIMGLLVLDGGGTGNQLYSLFYGVAAGCLLSGQGLWLAWQSRDPIGPAARVAAVAVAAAGSLAVLIAVVPRLDLGPADTALVLYGGLLVALTAIYVFARLALRHSTWFASFLVAAGVVAMGALDKPIDTLEPALSNTQQQTRSGRRVTPELFAALKWIRENTATSDVLAVNSKLTEIGPFEFVYAAFGERRVFLEGWGYSTRSRDAGYGDVSTGVRNPFAARLALNQAALGEGSREALGRLSARYGVRYLIVDDVNGFPVDRRALSAVASPVYEAPRVTIFELPPR